MAACVMPGQVCLCVVRVAFLRWLARGSLCFAGWAGWISDEEQEMQEPRYYKKPRSQQPNTVWHSLKAKAKRLGKFGLGLACRSHHTKTKLGVHIGVGGLQFWHCEVSFHHCHSVLARRCAADQQCSHRFSGHIIFRCVMRVALPLSVVGPLEPTYCL